MSRREIFAWLALGFVLGFLVALYLTRDTPPPAPCADARTPPNAAGDEREGKNISTADFRHEGVG